MAEREGRRQVTLSALADPTLETTATHDTRDS